VAGPLAEAKFRVSLATSAKVRFSSVLLEDFASAILEWDEANVEDMGSSIEVVVPFLVNGEAREYTLAVLEDDIKSSKAPTLAEVHAALSKAQSLLDEDRIWKQVTTLGQALAGSTTTFVERFSVTYTGFLQLLESQENPCPWRSRS
jgi:hypothetical protein